ncbi:MAG TPA: glycerophosphodiester phosphodiesterase family protein [Pyrinomonadaceae bacterium]|nr:glycerophosphodiester phosphodiesterase family protein [Pyrinomonadaceae bacterium]
MIIAHRGASAVAPENTLAAFARAMAEGADGIELDVRLSRDGVPMVIHDETLLRTGLRQESVAEMNAQQLGEVDVGSWFNRAHPRHAREDYARECVPTLDQVFSVFQDRDARLYVEMKTGANEGFADLTQAVAQLIKEYRMHSRVVVVSFDLAAIAQIKQIDPAIRTGALFELKRDLTTIVRKQPIIEAAVASSANEILLHRSIATRSAIRLATENDLPVVVWTVDDPKWIGRARSLGIQALITNNPTEMVRAAVSIRSPRVSKGSSDDPLRAID